MPTNLLIDDPEIKMRLIDGFCKGYTDAEACLAAGIGKTTLFDYIAIHPEFGEYKEELKKNPILTAKSKVVSELAKDTSTAKWYLERKTTEFRPPDRQLSNTSNTLILLTESQLKDRVAHKLAKLLSLGGGSDTTDDATNGTTDADYTEDMSNTEPED